MAAVTALLVLHLIASVTSSTPAYQTRADFLNQKWSPDWIEKAPEGFGYSWMIFEDEDGNVRLADDSNAIDSSTQNDFSSGEVTFALYTRKTGSKQPETITLEETKFLENSTFDANHPTKIVTHGWQSSVKSVAVRNILEGYLKRGEYNVITVDWSKIAGTFLYHKAASDTVMVGGKVATLIEKILERESGSHPAARRRREAREYDLLSKFHILGHSLGAHVAGSAGKALGDKKIGRITGLDPASPGFDFLTTIAPKLTKDDAHFVDVIHTTAGTLGIKGPVGHVDFYPNGGTSAQPGCEGFLLGPAETCSHGRAYEYYAESINTDSLVGIRCDNFFNFKDGHCNGKEKAVMGEDVPEDTRGTYYLITNKMPPFAPTGRQRMIDTNDLSGDKSD